MGFGLGFDIVKAEASYHNLAQNRRARQIILVMMGGHHKVIGMGTGREDQLGP